MSKAQLRVLAIPGSLRRRSFNRALLAAATELAPDDLDIEIHPIDRIPLYNADVEEEGIPEAVSALRAAIADADAILIGCPEYNHGVTGVLKNTVDWLSRPPRPQAFDRKPTAIVGATPGRFGTVSSQMQLRQALELLNARVMPQPRLLIAGASPLFDEDLRLSDDDSRKRLQSFLVAFAEWIRRVS